MRLRICSLALGLAVAAAAPAHAVDGVIEINQTKALAGGVTAGDTEGFPVTIDAPGSYRLTGSLQVDDGAVTAVEIRADDVTLDLNGFTIAGPYDCGSPSFALGHGIHSSGMNTTVRNGSVRGVGYRGIQGATTVEAMRVLCNGQEGILVGADARIVGNTVYNNAANGIKGGTLAMVIVRDNVVKDDDIDIGTGIVERNVVSGAPTCIRVGSAVVAYNHVRDCGRGIWAGAGSTIIGNTANDNSVAGITAGSGSTLKDNTASGNTFDGLRCGKGCTVIGNTARGNGEYGLGASNYTGYANNVFTSNPSGATTNAPLEFGTNICGTDTTCP